MVRVYFLRNDRARKRGYVADLPHNLNCYYVDPFIIVQIDEKEIPKEWLGDPTVRLDLNKLMKQYPNTTEDYLDEDGNAQTRTVYGYFHEKGRSVVEGCPVITMSDVLRGEV